MAAIYLAVSLFECMHVAKGMRVTYCVGSVTQLELADCEVYLINSDAESYLLIHVLALSRCM